ncbi:MAG: DUF305 domain-containing protein [Thermoleophilia bacterium]|nr:DUF305 domain-containing protein [Thermoleophilia bacterium]
MKRTSTTWGLVCIVIGVVLLVVMSLLWGLGVWGPCGSTADCAFGGITGDIDRHFIEQMVPHHEDAVAMADLALSRAEHSELRALAETIKRDQSREIDQMLAWYRSWYGVDAPTDESVSRGRGMGRGVMGGGMMHDEGDMEVLEAAPVFDKEFIRQMIPHHQMGVMMARMVLARTDRPEIEDLARSIIRTQTDETEQMRDWYRDWYE